MHHQFLYCNAMTQTANPLISTLFSTEKYHLPIKLFINRWYLIWWRWWEPNSPPHYYTVPQRGFIFSQKVARIQSGMKITPQKAWWIFPLELSNPLKCRLSIQKYHRFTSGIFVSTSVDDVVAGEGFEPPSSGLWARRATSCSTPRRQYVLGAGDRNRTGTIANVIEGF